MHLSKCIVDAAIFVSEFAICTFSRKKKLLDLGHKDKEEHFENINIATNFEILQKYMKKMAL